MTFWMHDYTILFQKDKIQLWPTDDMSSDDKLNAISRFIILLSFILINYMKYLYLYQQS